jgi:transcriptional regulator with XRE-family HTH domain
MKRTESKFVTPASAATAVSLGRAIRQARLARNATQASMAQRARMGSVTWLRIEKGDVSVAFGNWLSALEQVGLLSFLAMASDPGADKLGVALRQEQARVRARPSTASIEDYDF